MKLTARRNQASTTTSFQGMMQDLLKKCSGLKRQQTLLLEARKEEGQKAPGNLKWTSLCFDGEVME